MSNLNETMEKITDFLQSETKTETIIGKQFQLGEFTCVPLIAIGMGFGGAVGETKQSTKGEGGAAGVGMTPVGFLATKGSDIQFVAVQNSKGLNAAFEKIPGLIEKFMDRNKTKETEKA